MLGNVAKGNIDEIIGKIAEYISKTIVEKYGL